MDELGYWDNIGKKGVVNGINRVLAWKQDVWGKIGRTQEVIGYWKYMQLYATKKTISKVDGLEQDWV